MIHAIEEGRTVVMLLGSTLSLNEAGQDSSIVSKLKRAKGNVIAKAFVSNIVVFISRLCFVSVFRGSGVTKPPCSLSYSSLDSYKASPTKVYINFHVHRN